MSKAQIYALLLGAMISLMGVQAHQSKSHTYQLQGDPLIIKPDSDTIKYKPSRFNTYKFDDRRGNPFSVHRSKSILDMKPSNLKRNIKVDSARTNYTIQEKIGNFYYRPPANYSYDKLNNQQDNKLLKDYWRNSGAGLGEATTTDGPKGLKPRIPLGSKLIGRIFGGDYVEFKPTGFVTLDFAYRRQRVANPAVPIARQSTGTLDFDPHANINLVGSIGEKLKIKTAFDTKASFDFENNFKVEYTGYPEEIIQKLEFGNINFTLPTTLITGSQNLFGVKSELQFGKLRVNTVLANQRASKDQVVIQGGGVQVRKFDLRATDYDENRHFFLSHFFRDNFEQSLRTLPVINSGVQVTRVEAYITNRTNNTQTLRNVVGFMDLAEGKPYKTGNTFVGSGSASQPSSNNSNDLYNNLIANTSFRNAQEISGAAAGQGLRKGEDFELLRGARQLSASEFNFHPQLGYISLNTPLRNDEILTVAYEYTYNGKVFKVGELSDDYLNRAQDEVIFLKMLRPSTIRTDLPMWDLMMKNIYSLNATNVSPDNFYLEIIYRDDITGIDNPTLQDGTNTKDVNLLKIFGLDQLNPRGDRQIDSQGNIIGDGNFDFVEGITINTANGRIIFPVLEPFGSHLQKEFTPTEQNLVNRYVFDELYDGTRNDAQNNFANKNKFFIKGQYEGSAGNSQYLPGINVAENSVTVKAGNTLLKEGVDYTVNYSTGEVTVTNEAVLNSGKEVTIDYEKADLFNVQPRTMLGARFDYDLQKDIKVGATILTLKERPILSRVAIGNEPLNNTMIGADIALQKDSRFLTRMVDALPLIQTKKKSSINFSAEVAQLRPNAAKLSGAVSYLDDFEGAERPFDMTSTAALRWKLGSTPISLVPSIPTNPLELSYNRALMAWYNVDNTFYRSGSGDRGRPENLTDADLSNHYMRAISPQEIFPNRGLSNIATNQNTFDIAYFPDERGPFNYNPNLTSNGKLPNPKQNFGAITRAITSEVDFDNANIEYIEFWLLDPFIEGERGRVIVDGNNGVNNTTGGELIFQLGSISEDVMKDDQHFFENGLPVTSEGQKDTSPWGYVPAQQYINNAFSNTSGTRGLQDVGLDGLQNDEEATFFNTYLNALPPSVRNIIADDPSADNFRFYLGADLDAKDAKIIERYKYYNNTEGNSPETSANSSTASSTNLPDNEDLNTDNTLSDLEEYYEYRLQLNPANLAVGKKYVVDKIEVSDPELNKGDKVTWYQMRIPIREFDGKIGNINGFKSIRYMRMVMTGYEQPVVLRMAQFQLIANQWRRYLGNLNDRSLQLPSEPYDPNFFVSTVNIEENSAISQDGAIPYDMPPGSTRDVDVTSINDRQLNEQSLQLCVQDLKDKDARAVYKNVNFDFRFYKRLKMYIHASSQDAQDGELYAFVRIGTDYTDNYYEVQVPLEFTTLADVNGAPGRAARQRAIWPLANELDISIEDIINTKVERNRNFNNQNFFIPYTKEVGKYKVRVVGNPDLSTAMVMMLGVRNPSINGDDLQPKSACVWFDELRAEGFDQTKGMAAVTNLNLKLADFANINVSAGIKTFGFGAINTSIAQREVKTTKEAEVQGVFALDKFIPQELGLQIPMFVSYSRSNASPKFDPLDPDVKLDNSLNKFENQGDKKAYRKLVEDNETRRSINFTNVKKIKTSDKAHIYDISNFSFTWAYADIQRSNINTASYLEQNWKTGIAYGYSPKIKPWEPFKKMKIFKSPWLHLLRDFNIAFGPTNISVRGDLDRTFKKIERRYGSLASAQAKPIYEKIFLFNRQYNLQWSFTKSLTASYNASASAVIDEPVGEINTRANRDSVRTNLLNLGRLKNFNQDITFNYKLPLKKLPVTDWIGADLSYKVGYKWRAGSVGLDKILGNDMSNSRNKSARTKFDFVKLYNKVEGLKKINKYKPKPKGKKKVPPSNAPKPPLDTLKNKRPSVVESPALRIALRTIMSLRSINVSYNLAENTILPGMLPTPRFLGMDDNWDAPGWDFVLGSQDPNIRFVAEENRWLANVDTNIVQNMPFVQNITETINVKADFEPFKGLKIQLQAKRNRSNGYQEIFRDTIRSDANYDFVSLTPVRTGSYGLTIISLNTLFRSEDNTIKSPTFNTFKRNTQIFQQRFTNQNPFSSGDKSYSDKSQDVLISAFMAAYTGQDPNTSKLTAFRNIPLPNWRINYSGLSKLPTFKKIFKSFSINHSYSSEYKVGNYTSSLEYYEQDKIGVGVSELDYITPTKSNRIDGTFVPVFVINQVQISERMSPLLGFNMKTQSDYLFKISYNKARNLGLNLSNAQVTEVRSSDIIVGFGFSKRNVRLPFRDADQKRIILKNKLDFRLDFSIRDTKSFQRSLEQESVVTAGNRNIQLKPNISYNFNKNFTMQTYYERSINRPAISTSFPRKTAIFGIRLRYNLTE